MGPNISAYIAAESLPPNIGDSMTRKSVQSYLTSSIKSTTSITAKSAIKISLRGMNS